MKGGLQGLSAYFTGSVRRQLIWGVALVHALMMTLFVHDLTVRQEDFLIESQTEEAKDLAKTLSLTAITPMLSSDLAGLQELIRAVSQYPGVSHVMVIHKTGMILAHGDPDKRGLYLANMSALSSEHPKEPQIISRSRTLVDVVIPVLANQDQLGWIRVGVSQSATSKKLESITTTGLAYTALAIIAGALLAWFMASRLTARLTNLRYVADSISNGNMQIRASKTGTDELGHLALAFNFMLDALALRAQKETQLQNDLQAERDLAEVTLASIGDAVITTDATGNVTFLNVVAEKIVGWTNSEARGRPFSEVFHVIDAATRYVASTPLHELLMIDTAFPPTSQPLLLSRNGCEFNIEDSAAPIYARNGGLLGCVLVFKDMTEKHKIQQKIQWQAAHDALTGLPNRVLLADRFNRALDKARRNNNLLAVCVLDLDQFKPVNDTYGHDAGDKLLIQVAERLSQQLRGIDTLSRLGGDEFVMLFEDVDDLLGLKVPLERILETLAMPFIIDDQMINVSASIGVTIYPLDNSDADTLMRHADQAMYLAKQAGRNQISWFDVHHDRHVQESHQIVSNVRKALEHNELVLYYQPQIDGESGLVSGVEALVRWQNPTLGLVSPGRFIPLAEQSSLIDEIGTWCLHAACRQFVEWQAEGVAIPRVAVNVSARQLRGAGFAAWVMETIRSYGIKPQQLELELTESLLTEDTVRTFAIFKELRAQGIRIAIDDFGTGYSSLKYLADFPVDVLKIDQSFVARLHEQSESLYVLQAMVMLADGLNIETVAEGVETEDQRAQLLALGTNHLQGYLLARPQPAAELAQVVERFKAVAEGKQTRHLQSSPR